MEANPGPMTKAQEDKLDLVFRTILRLEAKNASLLEGVNKILLIHINIKSDLEALTKSVRELETKSLAAASTETGNSHDGNFTCIKKKNR